jgi:hypothetical protein
MLATKNRCQLYEAWRDLMQTRFHGQGAGDRRVIDLTKDNEVIDLTSDVDEYNRGIQPTLGICEPRI